MGLPVAHGEAVTVGGTPYIDGGVAGPGRAPARVWRAIGVT